MKLLRRIFLENLGTKLMALVLALLLWIYLYNESTESGEFDAVFEPRIEETGLAHWQIQDSDGRALAGKISIKLTGPKGELRGISRKGLRCEPKFEKNLFADELGATFSRDLSIDDLNLPDVFRVDFRPSKQITIKYVKYRTSRVKVVLPNPAWEGKAATDFMVTGVKLLEPPESEPFVQVRHPADRALTEIRLRPVVVNRLSRSDDQIRGLPETEEASIRIIDKIRLEVVVKPETMTLPVKNVPLVLAGDNVLTSRIMLETKTISITVEGPKSDIAKIDPSSPARSFFAYAIVDGTLPQVGDKGLLKEIYCDLRDPALGSRLIVRVDADQAAEYKVVK